MAADQLPTAWARDSRCPTLLLVDDDPAVLEIVGRLAAGAGFAPVACEGGADALACLGYRHADVAVVDLRMPGIGGLEVVRAIRKSDPECQIVMMSGAATIESAVEAARLGAIEYLTKPFDFDRLKTLLRTAGEEARRRRTLAAEQKDVRSVEFCGMVGPSRPMQRLFDVIRRLGPHLRTVLITGETGVGKELVARALHLCGSRRERRFVSVNCAAVIQSLLESEAFGQVNGAFTGATDALQGLFECADGGTLFLDEVAELAPAIQAKLLRVLETGEVRRLGAITARQIDVHVIAATNRDLRAEIAAGRFRADLFYRLNVAELAVPPLRERREDIPHLTAAFIREIGPRLGKRLIGVTPAAERRLAEARWDGNVRELRGTVERACILATGKFINERDLDGCTTFTARSHATVRWQAAEPATIPADAQSASTLERRHILEVLQRTGGNKVKTARILGLSRRALYRRLERYGLKPRQPAPE